MYPELSEAERFPLLTPRGRELLHQMRQHPNAPIWNWPNGEQLDQAGLERVRAFASAINGQAKKEDATSVPGWLESFVERCLYEVPYYRAHSKPGTPFHELPTCCRADLAPRVWEFVPDTESLSDVIVFSSSGTTGYPTRTPHHPFSAACGVPLMEYALQSLAGIQLPRGPDQVAITNVAAYPDAFTTAIVIAFLEEAGCIRVNLDVSAWRAESDRERFINSWRAPIWLGDPIALRALESLPIDYAPTAILSSIMHLSQEQSDRLSKRYGCPVLDLYAMTEAGIIGVRTIHGHRILPPDLYVEILDNNDQPCSAGVRGEITLSGGRNPFLPLLRYRTGDYASLSVVDGYRVLVGLSGREPIEYPTTSGRVVHSMELTRLMRRHPVLRYELQRGPEGQYVLRFQGDTDVNLLRRDLFEVFGEELDVVQR